MQKLKFPAPYFGGKGMAAHLVWQALGQPKHYMEPFLGSGAVLLARPDPPQVETVCDADGYVANVWRALKWAPEEVAEWCDWPVNHVDLAARRRELLRGEEIITAMVEDEKWFDARLAGYWLWCSSLWIGSGMMNRPKGLGQIPSLAYTSRPSNKPLIKAALGKIPYLGSGGGAGNRALLNQVPHLTTPGQGIVRRANLLEWFGALAARIRGVRVVCGDWSRICGGNWQAIKFVDCGIFLDPPYSEGARGLYDKDSATVSADVRAWARERGARPEYRIVLAGYYEEHAELLGAGWRAVRWKGKGGYGNQGEDNANARRETLFLSPQCKEVDGEAKDPDQHPGDASE